MKLVRIVQSYIIEFDRAFETGDLDRCYAIERDYDERIRELGIDPTKLHEIIVYAEENGGNVESSILEVLK